MKQIMLYNHSGCENRGCEAIVRSTSHLFAERGMQRICLSSDQAHVDRQLSLPDVQEIFPSTISPLSVKRLINSVGYRLGMPRDHEVARKYSPVIIHGKKSDLALSVGGDTYCYQPQEHMRVINDRLKRADIPLVLWGCSVDPERLEDAQILHDLQAYDLCVARESITAETLRSYGLPVVTRCDPAFALEKAEKPLPEAWGMTVGINISPLVLDRMVDRENGILWICELIRHILKEPSRSVALFAHVTWAHDNDVSVCQSIKDAFAHEPRVIVLPENLTATEIKGYIARMDLLITARTHASIAGYSMAIPTLVIGYSVKAKGIARDIFGCEDGHVLPAQDIKSAVQLITAYDALKERKCEEEAFLKRRIPEYQMDHDHAVDTVLRMTR